MYSRCKYELCCNIQRRSNNFEHTLQDKQRAKKVGPNFLARVTIRDVSNSDPSLAQNLIALIPIYFNKMRLRHIHILFTLYLDSLVRSSHLGIKRIQAIFIKI